MNERLKNGHVEYDADGNITRVRCMNCGITVGLMDEMPSKKYPGKTFMQFKWLSNRRSGTPISLSDGSGMRPILCADCHPIENTIDQDAILETAKVGWTRDMEALRRSPEDIQKVAEIRGALSVVKEEQDGRELL
jgi:hypothetical protein